MVQLSLVKELIRRRWVFTIKCLSDRSIEHYKARLVAQGYNQTYEIDYCETFGPVAKDNNRRILISLAAHFNWPSLQYDVKVRARHIYEDAPWIF